MSVRVHVAPVFTPARIQENASGKLFLDWFRARGYDQRAENGGVGSVVVGFRVFGTPQFALQRSQNTYFKGF